MPPPSSTRPDSVPTTSTPTPATAWLRPLARFIRTFGIDEPMGCYDDLEHADAFVLWGSNMAEMHPILWSRLTDTRLTKAGCEVHVLSTFEHRCFDLADNNMVFTPQTDLAILNYIANYIIQNKAYNQDVHRQARQLYQDTDRYRLWPASRESAGKGCQECRQGQTFHRSASRNTPNPSNLIRWNTLRELSGVPEENLERLAKLYADPEQQGHVLLDHGL